MRLFANEEFVRFEVCRSMEEQSLVFAVLDLVQAKESPLKLMFFPKQLCQEKGFDPDKVDDKCKAWKVIAEAVVDKFVSMQGKVASSDLQQSVNELNKVISGLRLLSSKQKCV